MPIMNMAGYKFIALQELAALRAIWRSQCDAMHLKGTVLLSAEGINISLAGSVEDMAAFRAWLLTDPRFADMSFRESTSAYQPFKRMKVKLKKEIITMQQPGMVLEAPRAPSITPSEFKQWLDEKRDITVLDTRNDYEVRYGTFRDAVHFELDDFSHFPEAVNRSGLHPTKPIVMFCTGGVRCEKAALHMLKEGYTDVYQLDGGILNYFSQVGADHYEGECFVFDERVTVGPSLS